MTKNLVNGRRSFEYTSASPFFVSAVDTPSKPRSKSAFADVPKAPEDPILGVSVAYNACKDPKKLNLGVGAYRTEQGKPYILDIVKKVEEDLVRATLDKEYLPIDGLPAFRARTSELLFGPDSAVIQEKRVATIQGLSGTGSLRIAAGFINKFLPDATVYVSIPTWGNHKNIFPQAGSKIGEYRYYDYANNSLDIEGMLADLKAAPAKSVIVLHACAHNPTGVDPTPEQWSRIADVLLEKQHVALFDVAYQGFASGDLIRDAQAVRSCVDRGVPMLVTQSYAKNMGLYGLRVGALNVVCADADEAVRVLSQLKTIVRPMYSNPPVHGARIAAAILGDKDKFEQWRVELKGMADRIISMRQQLRAALEANGAPGTWNHITDQIGMFSFTGLTKPQVELITSKWFVFMTSDGRISMAGLNTSNVQYLADAIKDVLLALPPS